MKHSGLVVAASHQPRTSPFPPTRTARLVLLPVATVAVLPTPYIRRSFHDLLDLRPDQSPPGSTSDVAREVRDPIIRYCKRSAAILLHERLRFGQLVPIWLHRTTSRLGFSSQATCPQVSTSLFGARWRLCSDLRPEPRLRATYPQEASVLAARLRRRSKDAHCLALVSHPAALT